MLFLALSSARARGVIWATSIDDAARVWIVESSGGARYAEGWLLSTRSTSSRELVAQRFDRARLAVAGDPQPVRDGLVGASTTGANLAFSVTASGVLVVDRPSSGGALVSQLTWVDRTGRPLTTVGPAGSVSHFALAPDTERVVAARGISGGDLWLFAPSRAEGTRLTYQSWVQRPLWALDERHVYYSDRTRPGFSRL